MANDLIHDRGRGPELIGTRITVYNLLPYFLDPTVTEEYICRVNSLTPEQVAAARAYVLIHADTVLAEHLKIEERIAAGNPPSVIAQAEKTRETFVRFKEWLAQREAAGEHEDADRAGSAATLLPSFRDWINAREAPLGER